ncbi:hypothetical protein [Flavobacterium sp. LB2P53]|uniref:hypothetical protein n=1 Tax=Flavobacterium sp. LB2P53 TaxID=2497481 RepID=UPI000F8395F2|nr:hypothetical protein [Flavobacterium sp. LB2P53]RTY70350.1 hypothetical protein EKL95_03080 [Flavobacterium sp. LB2P53]
MKLTTQQIALIEETLVLNGLKYYDIKLEVTDHIASEIEERLCDKKSSFEVVFDEVLQKWKPELQPSFSGLIGFTNPRIMTVKCHKIVKRQLITVITISSLITLSLMVFVRNSSYGLVLANIQGALRSFVLVEFCLVILAWGLIWKSKIQTTYSYLMKKKSFGLIIFLFMIGIGLFPVMLNHPDAKIAFVSVFSVITYVLITGIYLQLAYKHFEFEKTLSFTKP